MSKYLESFRELYPDYSDEKIEEIIERKIKFRQGIVENFDKFYDVDSFK